MAGLSSRQLMFEPDHVEFEVEKVALEQACLRVLRFSLFRSSHQRSIFMISVLWDVTPCNFSKSFRPSERTWQRIVLGLLFADEMAIALRSVRVIVRMDEA